MLNSKKILERVLKLYDRRNWNLDQLVEEHHSPDSFELYVDVLMDNGLEAEPVSVPSIHIDKLEPPFIAFTPSHATSKFILVSGTEEDKFQCYDGLTEFQISEDDLKVIWSNAVIIISESEKHLEYKGQKKKKLSLISFLIIFTSLGVFNYAMHDLFIYWMISSVFSIIGLFLSIQLQSISSGQPNSYCSTEDKFDCNIATEGRFKIFNKFSLGELAMTYFFTYTAIVFFFFTGYNKSAITFLFLLSCVGMPFVIYGILLQSFVIKKWCLFCLFIALVVIIQFSTFGVYLIKKEFFQWISIDLNFGFFVIQLTLIYFFLAQSKFRIVNIYDINKRINEYSRNFIVWSSLVKNSRSIELPQFQHPTFGNLDSEDHIVLFLSPFCKNCQVCLREFIKLRNEFENIFQFHIILRPYHPTNQETELIIRVLLESFQLNGNSEFLYDLKEWYSLSEASKMMRLKDYNLPQGPDNQKLYEEHLKYCEAQNINKVPILTVNEKIIPHPLDIKESKYFLRRISQ